MTAPPLFPDRPELNDLGFGTRATRAAGLRLLNRDGSFNIVRHGLGFIRSHAIFQMLITMPWWQFHLLVLGSYAAANLFFGAAYFAFGPEALVGGTAVYGPARFVEGVIFSVHTITTVGYGNFQPRGVLINAVVAIEAFAGMSGFAVIAATYFARLSRPIAQVRFSPTAVIAPYQGGTAFEFRLANGRRNQLIDVQVRVILTRIEELAGTRIRRFYELELERTKVGVLPMHWVVVHPIDRSSPLVGATRADLIAAEAEFIVLLTAIEDTFSQTVHTRTSYRYDEIEWNRIFLDLFETGESGRLVVDLSRLGETAPAPTESAA